MMCFKRKLEKSRVNVDTNSLVVFFYILKFIPQISSAMKSSYSDIDLLNRDFRSSQDRRYQWHNFRIYR